MTSLVQGVAGDGVFGVFGGHTKDTAVLEEERGQAKCLLDMTFEEVIEAERQQMRLADSPVTDIGSWFESNRESFVPPVCNKLLNKNQLKIMFVGGPNTRNDFHLDRGAEFFLQLRGTIYLPTIQQGRRKVVRIGEGQVFLLPPCIPHSPQRPEKGSLGLVVERERAEDELDGLRFFADFDTTNEVLWEKLFRCNDLGVDLPPVIKEFNGSIDKRTGKASAAHVQDPRFKIDGDTDVPDPFSLDDWVDNHKSDLAAGKTLNLFEGHPDPETKVLVSSAEESTCPAITHETWICQLRGHACVDVPGGRRFLGPGCCCLVDSNVAYSIRRAANSLSMTVTQNPDGNRARYNAMVGDAAIARVPTERLIDLQSARELAVHRAFRGRIVISGGGPVGGAMAVVFRRHGYEVDLYEKYEDLRLKPLNARRSINLIVARRGLRLAELLGVRDELLQRAVPVHGRMIHKDGEEMYQPYGHEDECNYSIDRGELNCFWLQMAAKAGAKLHFQRQLVAFDHDEGWCDFKPTAAADTSKVDTSKGGISVVVEAEAAASVERVEGVLMLMGCDGGGSPVREQLAAAGKLEQKLNFVEWGYKEVLFPAKPSGEYAMAKHALHIWPRGDHFLMALANPDGSFTGTMYADNEEPRPDGSELKSLPLPGDEFHKCGNTSQAEGRPSFQSSGKDLEAARDFWTTHYADALPLIDGDDGLRQYCKNPIGLLGTARADKYFCTGRGMHVVLAGDSAHAVVPFLGQGCQSGFEDCCVMNDVLVRMRAGEIPPSVPEVLEEYSKLRVPDCWALRDMAIENMTEMGSRVGEERFRLRKAIETRIETEFAHKYRSRYAHIQYSYNRYSNVQELGKIQDEVLEELMKDEKVTSADEIDMKLAEALIDAKLAPAYVKLNITIQADAAPTKKQKCS